jgi:hypothetical protein
MDVAASARQTGRRTENSTWMDRAIRIGILSYGVVHLLIAWLALRLAFGAPSGSTSSQGAFQQLAQSTVGRVSLYVVAFGFVALVVWQGLEAAFGHQDEEGNKRTFKRVASGGKAVVYATLAASSFSTAVGSSSGGSGTKGWTARLMGMPGGPLLVGAVGLGVLGVAGFLVYRGASEGFRSKLDQQGQSGREGRAYVRLGKAGYIAKGAALGIVGVLFLWAAISHDPSKSGGLDQALHELQRTPVGAPLLVVIALGLACYGLFCFAWARHLDR